MNEHRLLSLAHAVSEALGNLRLAGQDMIRARDKRIAAQEAEVERTEALDKARETYEKAKAELIAEAEK